MTPYWPREWESFVIILDKAGFSHKGVVVIDHNQGFAQVGAEAWTVGSQQQQVSDWGQVWSEPPGSGLLRCSPPCRVSITWELVRQLSSQTPPRSTESEAPGERPSRLCSGALWVILMQAAA